MAHGLHGGHGGIGGQDLDVTVLAFAQWLSEMKLRSSSSLQQMLAEMGIIRNGITSNNTDLTEFKRNTATVQQQMQSQISDLRDKLTDAYTEIANLKKTKSQFEQEVHAEYQSVAEQLQFKTLELEALKKAYAQTHQQLQQQIIQLQSEVNDLRMRSDDNSRQNHHSYEASVNKVSEVEMAAQYNNSEMKRLRQDHDNSISNLAENMNRWNETLRDLSKEFHDFQKVMNVNQQRLQSSVWEIQAKTGLMPSGSSSVLDTGNRLDGSGGGDTRSPPTRQVLSGMGQPPLQGGAMLQGSSLRSQSPATMQPGVRPGNRQPTMMPQSYNSAVGPQGPYMMR